MRHGKSKKNKGKNDKDQGYQKREWTPEETLEKGRIKVEITTSRSQNNTKLYSVSIRKRVLDRDGNPVLDFNEREKTSGYFRREDMNDIADLCKEAQQWIDADKYEDQQAKAIRNGRKNRVQQHA